MNKQSYLLKIGLFLLSLVLCFIIAEVAWRIIIFNNIRILESQKKADLYADAYSEDDYWKLQYLFRKSKTDKRKKQIKQKEHRLPSQRNKELFTRQVLRNTYKHVNFKDVKSRRPVLLYGDSFAACYAQDGCFEHILNNDKTFSKNYYLLNYGVGGYGLDQIYFLFKKSIDNYNDPFIVFSMMTLDLDRSILTVRDVPKTYYTLENDMLTLHERPSPFPDRESFYAKNKPQITSYLYRRILYSSAFNKLMPDQIVSYLKKEDYYKKKKIQINTRIMNEIVKELKLKEMDYVFLIFHPSWIDGVGHLNENVTDWRSSFIRRILEENNIPYIWAKDVIFKNMMGKDISLYDYYIRDGHPSELQKILLAEKIKEIVLNQELYLKIGNESIKKHM
jgi:hypothetical protein